MPIFMHCMRIGKRYHTVENVFLQNLFFCILLQEEHIKNVTKEFCDWVASLGGDSNNIEESTITSLFASGYETKPALSVPIHVVELTNVPPELRMSATVPQQQQQSKNLPQEEKQQTKWVGVLTYCT